MRGAEYSTVRNLTASGRKFWHHPMKTLRETRGADEGRCEVFEELNRVFAAVPTFTGSLAR